MSLLLDNNDEEEVDEPIIVIEKSPSLKATETNGNTGLLSMAIMGGEEEEEIDEPLPFLQPSASETDTTALATCSTEYTEALDGITSDCWDINSWMIYLEEVEQGKGGSTYICDAYDRFLGQFPRSVSVWKKLINHYLTTGNLKSCKETLNECLIHCRDIGLWKLQLDVTKLETIAASNPSQAEHYLQARTAYEDAFAKAIENIGFAIDSFDIWRRYIDFVKDWVETSMVESMKKIAALRKIYQRALCTPMEGAVDSLWSEYEAFEKLNGEPSSVDLLLGDLNRKFLHSKSICRERKRMVTSIVFDRLAVPPSNTSGEMAQLGQWDDWIRFEMSNPDNLSPELFTAILRLVYGKCLCCFRYHSEIWMSYTQFEKQQTGVAEARKVLTEAIECNANVSLLYIALSELEEEEENTDAAKEALQRGANGVPSGFTFSLLQRFVRRTEGVIAARRSFLDFLAAHGYSLPSSSSSSSSSSSASSSSTVATEGGCAEKAGTASSSKADNEKLFIEVFIAQAQLELDVNCDSEMALKVLNLARSAYPYIIADLFFLRTINKVLTKTGDLRQIRWVFQMALEVSDRLHDGGGNDSASAASSSSGADGDSGERDGGSNTGTGEKSYKRGKGPSSKIGRAAKLKDEIEILNEYIKSEIILGQCSIGRLNELKHRRDQSQGMLVELERAKDGLTLNSKEERDKLLNRGVFTASTDLVEKYQSFNNLPVPAADEDLKERGLYDSTASGAAPDQLTGSQRSGSGGTGAEQKTSRFGRRERDSMYGSNMSTEFHLSMSGLPSVAREFLSKLPLASKPATASDIDTFVRHMKNVILPPRPSSTEELGEAHTEAGEDSHTAGDSSTHAGEDWTNRKVAEDDDEDDKPIDQRKSKRASEEEDAKGDEDGDIFRRRQRARLNA